MTSQQITVDVDRSPIVLKVMGGPQGPKGDPNAGVALKGVAHTWPPNSRPEVGDLWVLPAQVPVGVPAWAKPGHGAFWNGSSWEDAGHLTGPRGDFGPPGPPLNIRGTATSWVPDAKPSGGDVWILPDTLPLGTPAGFTPGGAAAWDDVAKKWIPLQAIRGPAGRSVQVFGPSSSPPLGIPLYKGDIWLATDPSVFAPTFDASSIVPAPGPAGPSGPQGQSAYEIWKTVVGRPTAALTDYIEALRGPIGLTGPQGPAGDTFRIAGVVVDPTALPATPPKLTVYMTKSGELYIYDPTSTAALSTGWVPLGKLTGPAGAAATMLPPVGFTNDLPATGSPGVMCYVKDTGHVWSWDDVARAWVDAGRFGVGNLDDGNAQGQMLVWDDGNGRWVPTDVVRVPVGNQDGDVLEWDGTQGEWMPQRKRMGDEDNVYLPGDPATEYAVPVYSPSTDDFTVRQLKLTELEDGPGYLAPADGDLLAWDEVEKRYVPITPPPGTMLGLTDVDVSHHTLVNGEVMVYNALSHKFRPGIPAGSLRDYNSVTIYNSGQPVYHEGRIWRALKDGRLAKPEIANGAALLLITSASVASPPKTPTSISNAAPTTPPVGFGFMHLRYVSDTDWDIYTAEINATTRAFEWKILPLTTKTVWRHVALPPPDVTPDNAILWIYGMPGSTTPPIKNQEDWTPLNLGDFLVSLADVNAAKAKDGDILTSDGAGKWHAKAPAAYTKAETDSALAKIVAGIEHGIAVQSIANDPPTAPSAQEAWIVGTTPTGAFVGHANAVALWTGTAWTFTPPTAKEAHLVEDVGFIFGWTGTPLAWTKISQAGPQGPKGDKGDIGPVGPGLIQSMTLSAYNALATKDPNVLYVTYGT